MNPDESKALVELKDVVKIYQQGNVEVHALRGLTFKVLTGEFSAICGPSGSGKTTALNMIGALDSPTSGSVVVEGRNLASLSRKTLSRIRRDRIGFVFQAYNLIPVLTAYENAEIVMSLQGKSQEERHARVMGLLDEVGLKEMAHRRPYELSGGQQQRVAIARAIASGPAVVLADEPTANVDSDTADKLLALMEKLNQDRGVTFIFSTHDPKVMARAKRIIRLVDGRIVDDKSWEAV